MSDPTEEFSFVPENPVDPSQLKGEKPNPKDILPELNIYLVAGESSGDFIAAHLMESLKEQLPNPLLFYGVGGERMEEQGLSSLFPYQELSLLGVVELLPYIIKIFSRIDLVVDDIEKKRPDMVITIDSPGFCFRVVEKLRKQGYQGKCVHYVAPTVWAYKPERAEYCANLYDHMMVLMKFEKPYFDKAKLPCTWVGHPFVVESEKGNAQRFYEKHNIPEETTLFSLLPGSRKNEVIKHMPVFAKAITMLAPHYPNLGIVVAVPSLMMEHVAPYFEDCPFPAIITANDQDKKDAIAASSIAFVKSGTIALEVAVSGTPMIVAYRIHPLSALYLKRRTRIKYANLINIIQEEEVFPELLQDDCNSLMLASASMALLEDTARQKTQKAKTKIVEKQFIPLNNERPSDIAGRTIINLLYT